MSTKLAVTSGGGASAPFVDDVFSTYLYTGTGATQTITNGIDLASRGGLVWMKGRSAATDHALYDTARGATFDLASNLTTGATTQSAGLTAFTSTGFSIGALAKLNTNAATYTSWSFRKAQKFFDVVTYTGDGTLKTINHNLGDAPGFIIIKRTDTTGNWVAWHRTQTSTSYFNTTDSFSISARIDTVTPTSFRLANTEVAASGSYVAYLFAHDTSANGIIQCGSFNSSSEVVLGWEPQWVMVKRASVTGDHWYIADNMRGFTVNQGGQIVLESNLTNQDGTFASGRLTNRGFILTNTSGGAVGTDTFVYMAISRPNKAPTSTTQVYNAIQYTGNGSDNLARTGFGFPPDLVFGHTKQSAIEPSWYDRVRGPKRLISAGTSAENSPTGEGTFLQDGMTTGWSSGWLNSGSYNYILQGFKRSPGFFDVVCYDGTSGSNQTIAHNLGVVPELLIFKRRNSAVSWRTFCKYNSFLNGTSSTDSCDLPLEQTVINGSGYSESETFAAWPTSTSFTIKDAADLSGNGGAYVVYLFATAAGISKVGAYTGNGSSQTINCGFSTGARFVLIRRVTGSAGDWYIWDTARGIVSANDPHLSLNTTAAEVTTDDSVDPDNTGFIVNQVAATNINVTGSNYIYLAIA